MTVFNQAFNEWLTGRLMQSAHRRFTEVAAERLLISKPRTLRSAVSVVLGAALGVNGGLRRRQGLEAKRPGGA